MALRKTRNSSGVQVWVRSSFAALASVGRNWWQRFGRRVALEGAAQGGDQAGVLVRDHQAHPTQSTSLEGAQEPAPDHIVLAVTDVHTEHLAGALSGDAGGHHYGHRGHLRGGVA